MTTKRGTVTSIEGGIAFIEYDGKQAKIPQSRWNDDFTPTVGALVEFDDDKGQRKNLRSPGAAVRRKQGEVAPAALHESSRAPLTRDFRNPKNFVATPRRPIPGTTMGDLGPDTMRWHDRAHPGRYTGTIKVKATALTDLLISDSPRRLVDKVNHQTHPLRMSGDRALVPATTLKGAIRSAIEATTNSRMAVFTATQRLGSRVQADGSQLIPGRIEKVGESLMLRLLPGATPLGPTTRTTLMHAAWMDMAAATGKHQKKVSATITLWEHQRNGRTFKVYRASTVTCEGQELSTVLVPRGSFANVGGNDLKIEGWICATGNVARGKHDERIFFDTEQTRTPQLPISDELARQWSELLADYRRANEKAVSKDSKSPGGNWGKHVTDKSLGQLTDGMLLYVRLQMENGVPTVRGLYPVQLSRELDEMAPFDLLDQALRPAVNVHQLSPTDVLFGWVSQTKTSPAAIRGRVAIDDAFVDKKHIETGSRTLAILSSPKPHQARFYLGLERPGDQVTVPFPDGAAKTDVRYNDKKTQQQVGDYPAHLPKRLRGRAIYLRHSKVNIEESSRKDKDDQNRTVTGWVKKDATFEFEVHVDDITLWELGALLFVLNGEADECDLNLGYGKPLGFGSISLSANCEGLRTTEQLTSWLLDAAADYEPSTQSAPSSLLHDAGEAFTTESAQAFGRPFEDLPHIVAWRAARRISDLPVRYPRESERVDPAGKNFVWFTRNERTRGAEPVHGLSLPDLRNDVGLPYLGR